MNKDKLQICPLCKAGFSCDVTKGKDSCWCFKLPTLSKTNTEAKDCYCPRCLKKLLEEEKASRTKK